MIYFWLLFSKVNVVSFNTEASTDGGSDITSCFSERLALAVPENKRSLKKYIDAFIAQRKSNNYEFFSLSCFTSASSLACVAVVSVSFRLIGQARKSARKKGEKKKKEKGWKGWGRKGNRFFFLPLPLLFSSRVLLRLSR